MAIVDTAAFAVVQSRMDGDGESHAMADAQDY